MRKILLLFMMAMAVLSCSKEDDPCEGITCINGGTCINGECDCPDGYTGPDCGTEEVPSKIRVTEVRVLEFPATDDNGAGWDPLSGADLFFTMSYRDNFIYRHNSRVTNADPNQVHTFIPSTRLNMTPTDEEFVISIYDYDDFGEDDFMRGIRFVPYQVGLGFPKTVSLDADQNFSVEIDFEYSF